MTDLVKEARGAAKRLGEAAREVRPKPFNATEPVRAAAVSRFVDVEVALAHKTILDLASRLEALEAAQRWRPIEEAKRLPCLGWKDGWSRARVCTWSAGSWWSNNAPSQPTHFMPLALPPQQDTRDGA